MHEVLYHNPGDLVTIVFESKNNNNERFDPEETPVVGRIVFPSLKTAPGYPKKMFKIDTGLYVYKFNLPMHKDSVGMYLLDILYKDSNHKVSNHLVKVICKIDSNMKFSVSAG